MKYYIMTDENEQEVRSFTPEELALAGGQSASLWPFPACRLDGVATVLTGGIKRRVQFFFRNEG